MKKYLSFFFVALFATMSFSITSCGDDNDEPSSTTGKMELTIDGKKQVFSYTMANVYGDTYSCTVYNNDDSLLFSIYDWDNVVKGSYLTDENFTLTWTADEAIIGMPTSNTSVKVDAKDSKNIKISFKNAKFEDMRGYNSFTVNGTITLPLD